MGLASLLISHNSFLQVDALVWDRQHSSDRTIWNGRLKKKGGVEPRLELASEFGIWPPGQQGVLGWWKTALHWLSFSGWRKCQGRPQPPIVSHTWPSYFQQHQVRKDGWCQVLMVSLYSHQILQLAETPSPFSVAVFNHRVFWSDTKRRTIRSADKNTGKDQKVLLKRPGQPFGLKVSLTSWFLDKSSSVSTVYLEVACFLVPSLNISCTCVLELITHLAAFTHFLLPQVMHVLSQPATPNPCQQLQCSHLCLLAPPRGKSTAMGSSGAQVGRGPMAVCRCPRGMLLSKDKITCSLPMESTFILLLSQTMVYQVKDSLSVPNLCLYPELLNSTRTNSTFVVQDLFKT